MNGINRTAGTSRKAPQKSKETPGKVVAETPDFAVNDYRQGIHDLQVHQVELAQQNEELRAIQIELEESRAQYMDLYDHAPVGYFTFDKKGWILSVNQTGSRQLGLEREDLFKKHFSAFLGREDSDLFYLHLKKTAASKNRQTCSLTICQKNGKSFYAQLDSTLFSPDAGESSLYRTTITDINERRELEEALKISETRYRRLFEAAREGILLLDAKSGKIIDVNPFLMEMLGYSYEELAGKKLWEIGCLKDIEASKTALKELRNRGFSSYDDLPMETKGGRIIAVEVVSTIYQANHHKVIQCNIRDITRRKILAAPPHTPHNGTERRVLERRDEPLGQKDQLEGFLKIKCNNLRLRQHLSC